MSKPFRSNIYSMLGDSCHETSAMPPDTDVVRLYIGVNISLSPFISTVPDIVTLSVGSPNISIAA